LGYRGGYLNVALKRDIKRAIKRAGVFEVLMQERPEMEFLNDNFNRSFFCS
jgi:hypothetical protein